MSIELKIKSKHLSEEARIIRFEEHKLLKKVAYRRRKHYESGSNAEYPIQKDKDKQKYNTLNNHRKYNVRNENRATFLARAYIAGVPYTQVEQKRKEENEYTFKVYILPRIASMVAKYGKTRVQKKSMEGKFPNRKEVDTPEFLQLVKDIQAWSKI